LDRLCGSVFPLSGKETARFTRHKESVIAVGFTADASRTISGSSDSDIRLWKVPGR
jgi:WD40 repeat protein